MAPQRSMPTSIGELVRLGIKALVEFIQSRDDQGAEHRRNRGSPPQGPMPDGHPVKCLSPAVEEGDTDQPITHEVAGLADKMMQLGPVRGADRAKKTGPERVKPSAGVVRRHGGRGFKGDHQNAERRRDPIQDGPQPGNLKRTHV